MKEIGIYSVRNKITNLIYVGLSTNIGHRFVSHKRQLISGKHKNKHMQSSCDKHGIDNFIFEIIEVCDATILCEREKFWIKYHRSHNRNHGYNKTFGGEFGRLSDEIYAQYSKRLKGCTISDEQKSRISKTLTGKKHSIHHIKNRVKSTRKFDDVIENQMMHLFNYGFSQKEIAGMYKAKETTINSIRRRYRNATNK